jgi:hypothetical protein
MVSFNSVALDLSGIGRTIDAYSQRQREEEEKRRNAAEVGAFGDRLLGTIATSGGAGGGAPSRAAEVLGVGANYADAVAGMESGGRYDAVGPTHPKLGRALGKYQVMEANVGPWTREVLGRELTGDQFLASREAQDAVFRTKFGQNVAKHGPADAFSMWHSGRPLAQAQNARDSLGTRTTDYVQRGMAALGHKAPQPVAREAGTQQVQVASAADADMRAPGGVETGQFNLPGGRGAVAGGSEISPDRIQMLREGLRSRNPAIQQMAIQEIQAIRAGQAKGASYDFQKVGDDLYRTDPRSGTAEKIVSGPAKEGRTPEAVQEFVWARQNGMTTAKTPVEYAAEKARILAEEKPKGAQKLTEAQERNRGLFVTALGELPIVEETFDSMGSWRGRAGEAIAGMTGYRGFTPESYQRGSNAIERIAQAALYSTSGATAPVEEVRKTAESVTPMPGDGEQTLKDKRERLTRMIEGIKQKAALLSGEAPATETQPAPSAAPQAAPASTDWTDVGGGFKIRKKQ